VKHAVLGLLMDRPMHGYDLKAALSPALPRERRVNDGVLYPLLRRMEAEGLLSGRAVPGSGGRQRIVYRPTAAGRREFTRWLEGPDDEEDEVTYDFLVGHPFLTKLLFLSRLEPDAAAEKVAAQVVASGEKLREFERIRDGMVARGVDHYRIEVLELGIAQQRERVRWLRRLLKASEQRRAA
jgi:DNA-binding PadR family transcriptional regulator